MASKEQFNLFIYGTLMNPFVFRAVLGLRLVTRSQHATDEDTVLARPAVLDGYKKISPDNTYVYASPDPNGRIRGYIVGPLPWESMAALRNYEGKNYRRKNTRVLTKNGDVKAITFIANTEQLKHSFGYQFRDDFKQEVLLDQKIDAALLETERKHLNTDDHSARRAVGELHGDAIRDIVRTHFEIGGISDYTIRHSLMETPLRDFQQITPDPEAKALAPNYLTMVIRQVIFNEIEGFIRRDFRYELDRMDHLDDYYDRTVSSLAALLMVNSSAKTIKLLISDCLADMSFQNNHLIDFVQWAVAAADALYERPLAKQEMAFIKTHTGRGHVPMGVELEFSEIGHDVIRDPEGKRLRDLKYDGFYFFRDFGLDILTWKLGGHIDDHHDKASARRRRGFFEVSLGNLSLEANISKPVTNDPWQLNQLIHEVMKFYDIAPHSLHISMQLRTPNKPVRGKLLPFAVMKCLFAIGGDPQRDENGILRIIRLSDEIVTLEPTPQMLFSEIRKRFSSDIDEHHSMVRSSQAAGKYVQQFRFLRLSPNTNYEPILMALKGIQLSLCPGAFLFPTQYETEPKHRRLFERMVKWGNNPTPLENEEIDVFLAHIYNGLIREQRGKPAHSQAYISWSLHQTRIMLEQFNALFEE